MLGWHFVRKRPVVVEHVVQGVGDWERTFARETLDEFPSLTLDLDENTRDGGWAIYFSGPAEDAEDFIDTLYFHFEPTYAEVTPE